MYKLHLFICTNAPTIEGKCGNKAAEELLTKVKTHFKDLGRKDVRINKSGCLGACEKGITAVLYPQNKWFFGLTKDDDQKLIAELEGVEGVEG